MNKYQNALNKIVKSCCPNCIDENGCSSCDIEKICNATAKSWVNTLQELVDKETPKKLKSKTDKDGRLLWICPNCGDVYMKFWSDVETITCRKYCDECGQKLYFGE